MLCSFAPSEEAQDLRFARHLPPRQRPAAVVRILRAAVMFLTWEERAGWPEDEGGTYVRRRTTP